MKTFTELLENINSADKKAEIYTKPDGKKGTRMVPVDKEVIKQEKTLEWLKSALAREAKATKPRQDDMEEQTEATMYCKDCGCEKGNPDPNCTCPNDNAQLKASQCTTEQSKCKSRKEDVQELTIADVQKATAMAKKRQEKEREAGKKSVSTADLAARMPKKEGKEEMAEGPFKGVGKMMMKRKLNKQYKKSDLANFDTSGISTKGKTPDEVRQKKSDYYHSHMDKAARAKKAMNRLSRKEATIPDGQTAMTKTPAMKDKDKKTIGKIADLMKRANEDVNEISKGMASRYIKKAQVSTADAAKSTERGYTDSRSPDRDIAKAGKAQTKKGIKTFINRNKGTSTAVDKLTGKAKVPAKEGMAQGIVKQKISREKDMDAKRHDRMMDRARTADTKKKNKMGQ